MLNGEKIDFTKDYTIGMRIYYIFVNELTGTKELYELIISAVHPDMLIGWEPKGCAHMIGPEDADNIFEERNVAEAFFKQIDVKAMYR